MSALPAAPHPPAETAHQLTHRMAQTMLDLEQKYGCATEVDLVRLGFTAAQTVTFGPSARAIAQDLRRGDRQVETVSAAGTFPQGLATARACLAIQVGRAPIAALAVAAALGRAEAYMVVGGETMAAEAVQSALSHAMETFDTDVLRPIAALADLLPAVTVSRRTGKVWIDPAATPRGAGQGAGGGRDIAPGHHHV